MSLASQMRTFHQKTAAFRQETFGTRTDGAPVTADYNAGEIPALRGYYSPLRTKEQTQQAGFLEEHDAAFRVPKTTAPPNYVPKIGDALSIKEGDIETVLRVDEVAGTHPLSAEWVLGCKAQN